MSKYLSSDVVFAKARKTEEVYIPELGCTVILRELSVKQLAEIALEKSDPVRQLAMMIVDESGELLFTTPGQIENLAEMSASVSAKLFDVLNKMTGVSTAGQDELLKN